MSKTYYLILKKIKDGKIGTSFTGSDLVKNGIKKGTAWTFLWKHKVGIDQPVNEYFKKNDDGTYSLK